MMTQLSESYRNVQYGSQTLNERGASPVSNQFIVSQERLREDSSPPSPLTALEASDYDYQFLSNNVQFAAQNLADPHANTTAQLRQGAKSVEPKASAKHRTTINLKGAMHMIGEEEEERDFVDEDTKSAISRSRSNPLNGTGSARDLHFKAVS